MSTATETKLSAAELTARGYRRVSNKYQRVVRIDRADWVLHLAAHLGRAPADLFIVHAHGENKLNYAYVVGPKVAGGWCDFYRRVLSNDMHTVPDIETFRAIPGSGHDDIGYVDTATLIEAEHRGWV